MAPPGVEIGRVGLHVLIIRGDPVRVEYELIRGEKQPAHGAFDALRPGGVVARRKEGPAAAPGALVVHGEREVVG